jgi:hypothetical protein
MIGIEFDQSSTTQCKEIIGAAIPRFEDLPGDEEIEKILHCSE